MRARLPIVCPKHGARFLVVKEQRPGNAYHSHAECSHVRNGRRCGHWKPLTEQQVKYVLKKYRYCETVDYTLDLIFDFEDGA